MTTTTNDARIDCQQRLIDELAREVQVLRGQRDAARAALLQVREERKALSLLCGRMLLEQVERRGYAHN